MKLCLVAAGFVGVMSFAALGCEPELPMPTGSPGDGGGGAAPGFALAVEPTAALDRVPSVVWLRIDTPPTGVTPDRVALASGELSPAHLRELATDEVSDALAARLVPTVAWSDGSAVVLAPTAALAADGLYTLVLSDLRLTATFHVDPAPPPVLPRVWPPVGLAASTGWGVWCGAAKLEAMPMTKAVLEPAGLGGQLVAGVEGVDARCISFHGAEGARHPPPSVAPPAVPGLVPSAGMDPRAFSVEAPPAPVRPLVCTTGEVAFGPGCVRVFDDRALGRSPEVPVLWAAHGSGVDVVWVTRPSDPFVLTGLPPAQSIELDLRSIDTTGRVLRTTFVAKTAPPMPHVVLNEVLANPIGAEPAEEWVELFNDGSAPAELAGFVLVDLGGETPLPSAILRPGGFALIVGADFVADDGFDPAPAPGTLLLRVPRVGKSGLSNEGEPLILRDPAGAAVSTFPPAPKPKSGLSVSRTKPSAPDGLGDSFVLTPPTPGAPNAPPVMTP